MSRFAGNVWIYSIRFQVDLVNSSSKNYCDSLTYQFAYWTLIVRWAFWLILVLIGIFTCVGFAILRLISRKRAGNRK